MSTNYPFLQGYRVIIVVSLFMAGAGSAMAALPDVLELGIVTAPGFVSSPCPLGNQSQSGTTSNPGSGTNAHAAHHPNLNTNKPVQTMTVPADEKSRSEMVKQLTDAGIYLSGLIQKIESGAK